MEKFDEILASVISTKLLAPTLGDLASTLGYKGRATLYRVRDGNASERAVASLTYKLEESMGIDRDALKTMYATISNTSRLSAFVKPYVNAKDPETAFAFVDAFVMGDFDSLPAKFRDTYLDGLLDFEKSDPEAFYNMLAYFYYRRSGLDYYVKGESHRQRSARVLETLGLRYLTRFRENGLAANYVYIYSRSEILNAEPPVLWSLITSLATLLQFYARPIETIENGLQLLGPSDTRSYWRADDERAVILTCASPLLTPRQKEYHTFRIGRDDTAVTYLGTLTFVSDEIMVFRTAEGVPAKLGVYEFDGTELRMEWENPKDNPTTAGNRWVALDKKQSQTLRNIDRATSDELLDFERLKSEGVTEMADYKVIDVTISREKLILTLRNGKALSISVDEMSFLKKVKPDYHVLIGRRVSDGEAFIFWPQIYHCVPLSFFTEK